MTIEIRGNQMLLVLPVPFRRDHGGQLMLETQAANGLKQWARSFAPLICSAPVIPDEIAAKQNCGVYQPVNELALPEQIQLQPLPWGYKPRDHFRLVASVRQTLSPLIAQSRYLQFAVSGCTFGDWGAVSARVARRAGRAYSVHTDWVTHRVLRRDINPWRLKSVARYGMCAAMHLAEYHVIRNANLGLFHGADCHTYYRQWCSNAHLIHNVHTDLQELISPAALREKAESVCRMSALRLIYAGRMAPMKQPERWLDVMSKLKQAGIEFEASWIGDGPLLAATRQRVQESHLAGCVKLPGFEADRSRVLEEIRKADCLVFCNREGESPRILIEALNQGTPIVGFESNYAMDLAKSGGGRLVCADNTELLAAELVTLARDRTLLSALVDEAGQAGRNFTADAVFEHRASLIKQMPIHAHDTDRQAATSTPITVSS